VLGQLLLAAFVVATTVADAASPSRPRNRREAEIACGQTLGKDRFCGHRVFKALPLKEWKSKLRNASEFCIWEDTSKD